MPCVLLVSCLMKFTCYVQVLQDTGVYGSSASCCEILKYSQVYEPYRSIVGQERGRTHRDLNEHRKIKSNLNQINSNLV